MQMSTSGGSATWISPLTIGCVVYPRARIRPNRFSVYSHVYTLKRIAVTFWPVVDKDRRSNGCFPRAEGTVEPCRVEERVEVRLGHGATLSLKPLDDRLAKPFC